MRRYRFTLAIDGAFSTPPKGDTLFGQLCWSLVELEGGESLDRWLEGYTNRRPSFVVSDMLAGDMVLFPPVPTAHLGIPFEAKKRKDLKRKRAITIGALEQRDYQIDKSTRLACESHESWLTSIQMRNRIDRRNDTTGNGFDPFASKRYDICRSSATLYMVVDEKRIDLSTLRKALEYIGKNGFGKDATIGRGRFTVTNVEPVSFDTEKSNALLTLAPSVLYGQNFEEVYYEPFTRFGKHGGYLAHGRVWKNPVLMADSFALVKTDSSSFFIGHGLGGDGTISKRMPKTVHQGYAVTIPVRLETVQ